MTGKNDAQRYLVPGLARGVEILRMFSRDRSTITAPEMARELGIPRSTMFRLVQTLEHLGLLESDAGGHSHRLGVGMLGFGFEYVSSLDVTEVGRPELERLRDATGLATHMVVRDGTEVVVVLKVPGRSAFSGSLSVGARLPAHGTVLGRVMLAGLDNQELRELFDGKSLPRFSDETPTNLDSLIALLAADRRRGYAVSQSYFEPGICSVAAPIRDNSGAVVAGINVTQAGELEIAGTIITAVRDCARTISGHLHYRPESTPSVAVNQ